MLGNDPDGYRSSPLHNEFTLNDRDVKVTAEYQGRGIYRISSVATTDDDSKTNIESYVYLGSSLFARAITALDGDANLIGNSLVISSPDPGCADIYADGNISLTGNVRVEGDATATGQISTQGNCTITGSIEPLYPPLDLPVVDTSIYLQEANKGSLIQGDLSISGNGQYNLGPAHITGNLKISGNRTVKLLGTVYVDGEIKMSGNTRIYGPGTLVAEGNITVTGNSRLDPDDIPVIISVSGGITVTGNNWTSMVLYAPEGEVSMAGNSEVYGSVVGKTVTVIGNSKIDYPVELGWRTDLPGGVGLDMISYNIDG